LWPHQCDLPIPTRTPKPQILTQRVARTTASGALRHEDEEDRTLDRKLGFNAPHRVVDKSMVCSMRCISISFLQCTACNDVVWAGPKTDVWVAGSPPRRTSMVALLGRHVYQLSQETHMHQW
jgi:hypothetical protein